MTDDRGTEVGSFKKQASGIRMQSYLFFSSENKKPEEVEQHDLGLEGVSGSDHGWGGVGVGLGRDGVGARPWRQRQHNVAILEMPPAPTRSQTSSWSRRMRSSFTPSENNAKGNCDELFEAHQRSRNGI